MEITKKRLEELQRMEAKLNALEAGGVDNWEWYSESLKEYHLENEIAERKDDLINDLCEAFGGCAFEPSERGAGIAFNDDVDNLVKNVLIEHKVTFSDLEINN